MKSPNAVPKILMAYRQLVPQSCNDAALFCGGAQRIATEIAIHVRQRQWTVYFASDDPPSARTVRYLVEHGVTHIRMPFQRLRTMASSVLSLTELARAQHLDLIHCHDRRTVVAGAIAGRLTSIPMLYTAHNVFQDKSLTGMFLGRHVAAVSEAVRQNLQQVFNRSAGSVRLIYNGVQVNRSSPQERSGLREELGLQQENRIIGVVGRLTQQKGHQYLLNAMPSIVKVFPELRVLFVGEGPLRHKLQAITHDLGLDAHVLFCGNRANATQFMEISEFMVAPSLWEGLPLAVMESLSLGVPVVASAIACHREIVAHGEAGLLVSVDQPGALAEAILFLLCHREQVSRMGQRCSEIARRDFSLPNMLAQYEEYYRELLHLPATVSGGRRSEPVAAVASSHEKFQG